MITFAKLLNPNMMIFAANTFCAVLNLTHFAVTGCGVSLAVGLACSMVAGLCFFSKG